MKKRDFETYHKRFRDFEILTKYSRDPRFSRYHSPPLIVQAGVACILHFRNANVI